jgi:Mg-chelatase subunit ChlD
MKAAWVLTLAVTVMIPLYPQNNWSPAILIEYKMEQVRYVSPEASPELIADYDTDVSITLKTAQALKPEQAPEVWYRQTAALCRPLNICFVIDISWSMADKINLDTGRIRLDQVQELCAQIITEKIRENDVVSVIAFYHEVVLVIKHQYIRGNEDRQKIIQEIKQIKPIELGNTFMRKALAAGYVLINALKNKEQYNNRVLLLTDGEEIENEREGESKSGVQEIVQKNKGEGIGTEVSAVAIGNLADRELMEQVAALGGGAYLFIEDNEKPSSRELDELVHDKNEFQDKLNALWTQAEFDVVFTLRDGASLQNAEPYMGVNPYLQDNRIIYPHIRLNRPIHLTVSLREAAVQRKSTVLSLSVTGTDTTRYVEQYPIALNNPVRTEGKGFVTFIIEKKSY